MHPSAAMRLEARWLVIYFAEQRPNLDTLSPIVWWGQYLLLGSSAPGSINGMSIAEPEDREVKTLGLHNSGMEHAYCTSTRGITNTVNTVLLALSENLKKWLSQMSVIYLCSHAYLHFLGVLVLFLDLVDVFCNENHGLLGIEQAVTAMVIWIKVLQQLLWIKT